VSPPFGHDCRKVVGTRGRGSATQRALITGIAGQDGSLLAELLLDEGYAVCGVVRRSDVVYDNLEGLADRVDVVECDLLDQGSLAELLRRQRPQEVYNLAAPSFVPLSWELPVRTAEFAAVGVTTMLEAIREVDPAIRFYQASSSEIFGEPSEVPQTERTPLAPLTPYGVAKAYGHFITRSYRKRYELHASSGILFNHESPRRPVDFVTRKVTAAAAAISLGLEQRLALGNLDGQRDWSYAGDSVRAMWLMLQQEEADDFVIASGQLRSVRDLLEVAFGCVALDWRDFVDVDSSLERGRAELHSLVGDATKARERLGWAPTVSFEEMIRMMVEADLERLERASSAI
jgi:GDPmannose 4,6-dehydratase